MLTNVDRYLKIARWAKARYTYRAPDGAQVCDLSYCGRTVPSRYSRIEDAAAVRYLGALRHWPQA